MSEKAAHIHLRSITGISFATKGLACALWGVALSVGVSLCSAAHAAGRLGQSASEGESAGLRAPKVGDAAPDFTLKSIDGSSEVTLSTFRGVKPVVLIFGSWT